MPFWITECGVGDNNKYPSQKGKTLSQAMSEFYNTVDECRDVPVAAVFYYPYEALATAPGKFTQAGEVLHKRTKSVYEKKSLTTKDSTRNNGEWNEFYHSPASLLSARTTYRFHFDYKDQEVESNASVYGLLRSSSNLSKATSLYHFPAKHSGTFDFSVDTGDVGDYELILGIQNRGKIQVDDIRITKEPAELKNDAP